MSTKRVLSVVLVASAVMLAVGTGPRFAGSAHALPAAQEPEPPGVTIPYPGRLDDEAGQPVADGAYDFVFTLYDAESGGEPLWSEVQEGVAVQGGAFNALLGSASGIPMEALAGGERWLAVGVRGPGESDFTVLTPRQRLSAAAPMSPASPAAPAAGPACPHDHWGELWQSDSGIGLRFENSGQTTVVRVGDMVGPAVYGETGSQPGVRGVSTSGIGVSGESNSSNGVYGASASGYGVHGASTSGDGMYGQAFAAGKSGVYGLNDAGYGVTGRSANGDGVQGLASAAYKSGVYAVNDNANGYGVTGKSNNGFGVYAVGKDDGLFAGKGDLLLGGNYGDVWAPGRLRLWSDEDVYVTLDANNDGANTFTIFNGAGSSIFSVDDGGNMWAAGFKAARVESANHGRRLLYAVESPEVWFEDFGTAALVDGEATVAFEPIFAETINLETDYHVFVTPLGDCQGLYVVAKTPTSFEVRELGGGTANIDFDYRIVAKRRGFEDIRLEPAAAPAIRDGS